MTSMEINETTIWYSNRIQGLEDSVLDEHGLETGATRSRYTDPAPLKLALSESIGLNNLTAQGVAEKKAYGIATNYTHRMITYDMDCPINEEAIIWHDRQPGSDPYSVPYNFVVIRATRTLNYKTYYLRQVDVGEDRW